MNPPIVVKIGGSLLDWDRSPSRIRAFLDRFRDERVVVVCGGGKLVDAIRELDRMHRLGDEVSHALAMKILDFSAKTAAEMVPGLARVESCEAFEDCWSRGVIPALAPRRFLEDDDRSADRLPHSWSTTSDSIAARLATRLGSSTLILLKSATLPPNCDRAGAARLGLVDPEFVKAAGALESVRYVNLRDSRPEVATLD